MREEIYGNRYMGLYSDGELGLNDGVGYVDTLCAAETRELYEALHKFFNK